MKPKKISVTHFIALFPLLRQSGTEPATPPRFTYTSYSVF